MSEKVSVVIPAYNVEPYISACLQSVLSQSRKPEEVIVVDDCSTDATAAIARSFSSKGVKLIQMPGNQGSAAARNLGIRAASHNLIAFQDADDLWLDHHSETVVPLLENHPDAVLAFSRAKVFQDEHWIWPIDLPAEQPVDCFLWCAGYTRIPQMNVIARRDVLLKEGGYNEVLRQGQDFDLFLRLSYKYPFICSHEITTRYRRHPGSITKRNLRRSYHYLYSAQNLFWNQHREEMNPSLLQSYERVVLDHWVHAVRQAWGSGDVDLMDFHLSQHHQIPGSAKAYRLWWLKRRAAVLRPAWGALLRATRRNQAYGSASLSAESTASSTSS